MIRLVVAGVLLTANLVGCGRQSDFSGPAPEGALDCALAHGAAAGYDLIDGSPDDGFLRLTQRLPPPPSDGDAANPRPDLGDVVLAPAAAQRGENRLLIVQTEGRLEITVLGSASPTAAGGPPSTAEAHARTMLAMCAGDRTTSEG